MNHNSKLLLKITFFVFIVLLIVGGSAGVVESKHDRALDKVEAMRNMLKECKEFKQQYPYAGKITCYANGEKQFEIATK